MRRRHWIGKAIKRPGALSRQLGIPVRENIPRRLLGAIRRAKVGTTLKNPTTKGRRVIKVVAANDPMCGILKGFTGIAGSALPRGLQTTVRYRQHNPNPWRRIPLTSLRLYASCATTPQPWLLSKLRHPSACTQRFGIQSGNILPA